MDLFDLFVNIKGDLSGLESSFSKAHSLAEGVSSKISSVFSTIGKIGSVALGAATSAVGVFAKTAIQAGLSFDSAMGEVAATAGKTEEELAQSTGSVDTAFGHFEGTLREFAQFMGANTAFSATQAAQALNYMALAGYDTQKSMNMLPAVLDMAAAGSMDLARASDMITDTQSALGLSIERTKLMVDEFAKAAATGNTSVEQLGDAFLTVGGLAKEANGGFITLADGSEAAVDGVQQLEIAFTAMANAGIKGSEAGTHMRNILLKLANPTKGGLEAFEKMGLSIYDANGQMKSMNVLFTELNAGLSAMSQQEKLAAIGEIFNARDTASAEALLAAVGQDWDRIGESILQAEGSASEMAATKLDNLNGDITKFKSALEGVRIAISDKAVPSLRDFVQLGTEGLSKMTEALKAGDMSKAMDVVGDVLQKGLNLIFGKIDMLVEAGAKIVGALAKGIIQNLPTLLTAAKRLLTDFVTGFDPASIADGITNFVQSIGDILGDSAGASKIAEAGTKIVAALAQGIMSALGTLMSVKNQLLSGFINGLMETIPTVLPNLVSGLQNLLANIKQFMLDRLAMVKELAPVLIEAGMQLLVALADGIISALPEIISAITDIIVFVSEQLLSGENISRIMNAALDLIVALGYGLISAIPQLAEAAIEIILSICEYLVNPANLARIVTTALQLIIQLALGLVSALPVLIAEIPNIIFSIFGAFWDGIVHTDWLSLGKEILTGLVKGMFAALGGILDAVGDVCSNIYNKVKNFFGIESPSKLMKNQIGKNIALGLAEGLEDGTSNVERAMEDMIGAASGDISGTVTTRETEMAINHTGTIRVEGVNNEGEFVAASEYVIEEILTNILKREARLA